MQVSVFRGPWRALVGVVVVTAVAGSLQSWSAEADDHLSTVGAMVAYDQLASVVEAKDVEAFKALMSAGLTERMTADWMIAEGVLSGPEYLARVPRVEPAIDDARAVFSKTYDEGKLTATYSIEFVGEDGRWKFDGYRVTTRSK